MRCLTVRQPWGWAILHGGKDVENRANRKGQAAAKAQFNRPGRVLLHAGARLEGRDAFQRVESLARVPVPQFGLPGAGAASAFGAFIASAWIDGVHIADDCWDPATGRYCSPWADPDAAHIQIRDVVELPWPVTYPGALGLWSIPETDTHVITAIRRQLT